MILDSGYAQGDVVVKQLDLSELRNIKAFADDILTEQRIDYLILNGAVAGLPLEYTKDGFEMVIGVNHFGHFALTQALLPRMKSQVQRRRVGSETNGRTEKCGHNSCTYARTHTHTCTYTRTHTQTDRHTQNSRTLILPLSLSVSLPHTHTHIHTRTHTHTHREREREREREIK
jgi:NADP-dependent 3-hydroxy acid dehydrogenase YdfG